MQAVIHYQIQGIECTNKLSMSELLRVYGRFHHFIIEDQTTKDWFIGYGLISGVAVSAFLPDEVPACGFPVLRVTFPFLDLSLL